MTPSKQQVHPQEARRRTSDNMSFYAHSTFLLWAWRVYGVDMSSRPPANECCAILLKFFTGLMLALMLCIVVITGIADVGVFVKAISTGQTDILYFMIPLLSTIIYPVLVYLYAFRVKRSLNKHFEDIVNTMHQTLDVGPDHLRILIRKWEIWVAAVFFVMYSASFVVHVPIVLMNIDDPFLRMMRNITRSAETIHLPTSVMFAVHGMGGHVYLVKFLMAATFIIFCTLLSKAFDMLNAQATEFLETSSATATTTTTSSDQNFFEELCFRHTRLCLLVEKTNGVFGTFLSTAFGIHVFNICFYARCIAFQHGWMTAMYHVVIVHIIVQFIAFFAMLCWAASSVNNKIYNLHRKLFYGGDFRSTALKNIKVDVLFYVMNATVNPIQICVFNYFPINMGFVLTVSNHKHSTKKKKNRS